jgi:tRNA (guanine-N7-)-methyltransferase
VDKNNSAQHHRPIRSFVLRQGRLTTAQQKAFDNYWQNYGIDFSEALLDLPALFGRTAPVTLEIGFGNGDSLLEQALTYSDRDFLGVEVHGPGVGHLLNRIHQEDISNLRVIRHDAVDVLNHQIPDNSLNCVQLYFPDPWHKKKHHKRRILQSSFISTIHKKLETGGMFHMATDWQHYAEHMLKEMENAKGFSNDAGKGNYSADKKTRPQTKFERRGLNLGHEVWDLVYKKIV